MIMIHRSIRFFNYRYIYIVPQSSTKVIKKCEFKVHVLRRERERERERLQSMPIPDLHGV